MCRLIVSSSVGKRSTNGVNPNRGNVALSCWPGGNSDLDDTVIRAVRLPLRSGAADYHVREGSCNAEGLRMKRLTIRRTTRRPSQSATQFGATTPHPADPVPPSAASSPCRHRSPSARQQPATCPAATTWHCAPGPVSYLCSYALCFGREYQ